MLLTIMYFIIALLILIIVHEYGHFVVARLCGVKVLTFSFGFGKKLFSWHDKRGTEYVYSLWPLGGYVKMLDETEGEVSPKERHLAFNQQSILKRIAIVAAGPLFNFLFALLALWLVLMIGVYSLAPMINGIKPGSLAAKAGLKANEEIVMFNTKPVASWHDMQYALMPLIGSDDTITLVVKSIDTGKHRTIRLPLAGWQLDAKKPDALDSIGIIPFIPTIIPIVGEVIVDSPASKAGFEVGDRIQTYNGQLVTDWLDLVDYVQKHPGEQLKLGLLRQGKSMTLSLLIGHHLVDGQPQGFIGLRSQKTDWPTEWLRFQRQGPLEALATACTQTIELTRTTFSLMGRFVTGKLALEHLSGPVGIAQGAGDSGRSGIASYLSFLALVSISLGVLNLLPIPMLDGGHLLFFLIEMVFRRPLPDRLKSIGLYLGLAFLLMITVVAFMNDISRLTG